MSSSHFQTNAFSTTINYVRGLFMSYQNISDLVDACYPDPTLHLDLILITEAVANEKNLTENLGYRRATFSSSLVIAAAIRHGILNVIRDSGKFPLTPEYIFMTFAG